jgi:glycine betaine/proline transport system ATP-binding protein
MDEAFSALDPLIRMDMQTVLLELQKEIRKTIVFITHDLDEALRLGDRIAILRDGEIVQQGTGQDIVLRPADSYISTFVKEVNRGRVIRVDSVMAALNGAPVGVQIGAQTGAAPMIPAGSVLEDAAKLLTERRQDAALVADTSGRPVGRVDIRTIVAAMVTPVSRD